MRRGISATTGAIELRGYGPSLWRSTEPKRCAPIHGLGAAAPARGAPGYRAHMRVSVGRRQECSGPRRGRGVTSGDVVATSRTLAAARRMVERGWSPVPVPARSKVPILSGWQNLRLTRDDLPAHFREGDNLGVHFGEPSGWVVDVDCDIPEALAAADALLPSTAAVYGRPGNPRSHRLYLVDSPVETTKWTDPTRKDGEGMVLELRATGAQSLVPPSVHPSGETYRWDADGEPFVTDGGTLKSLLAKAAAAALLARHWPAGARHEAALALAGALLRHAWDPDDAREFIAAVVHAA